ncbi:PGN_0703 family putative restriction endonuclease [Planococcus salinus]|uniref:Uncharacterized protein n=1 Tax=Planococcus salinus TaxID=1848460 RepID=A0A3M8P7I3_9BACL|nr:hypothetical protein [Planococcus salinus]RNF39607.1 hypothetical protein EEX84_09045 [Planococcus salinus]
MTFEQAMKIHLSDYKMTKLALTHPEKWRGKDKDYHYILPASQWELNFLSSYRTEIVKYITEEKVKLHQYFHHLNSSQAVCFNFFYPLIAEGQLPLLLKALQLSGEEVEAYKFEKNMPGKERTNFDFYLKLKSGKEVLFEVKYTENGFGKATDSERYQKQYRNVYRQMLAGKIQSGVSEYHALIKNYQLLRNIAYVDSGGEKQLILIGPKNNKKLHKEYENAMRDIITPELRKSIQMITWESLVERVKIQLMSNVNMHGKLADHYQEFQEKYFPV